MARIRFLITLVMILSACGGDGTETTTTAPAATTTAPTTTTAGTTSPATPTTVAPTTTSTTTTQAPAATTLPDGRPATFMAISDDYVAVEIDTATGETIHVFGQTGSSAEMAAAEEMPPNVLVGIWRTADGSNVGLSDCCEPAAGRLFFLGAEGELGEDPYSTTGPWNTGWTITPPPATNRFAVMGFALQILDPVAGEEVLSVWIDEPDLGFPGGAAAWARDESAVFWTAQLEQVTMLVTLDLSLEVPNPVSVLEWVGVNQYLDGIGSQESGNLVGFLHTLGSDFEIDETEGVVFSTSGELLATFPVEKGSLWGGYDTSGRFLIYVDGEDVVRWQGLGQSGTLGDGFYFASW